MARLFSVLRRSGPSTSALWLEIHSYRCTQASPLFYQRFRNVVHSRLGQIMQQLFLWWMGANSSVAWSFI
jgi:hypothetical protein